jgi:hypothetical protein
MVHENSGSAWLSTPITRKTKIKANVQANVCTPTNQHFPKPMAVLGI